MKKEIFSTLAALLVFSTASLLAQLPLVTITSADPHASEAGPDPGTLRVQRSGDLNHPLTVYYRTSGTASNGVDYQTLSNAVTFSVGADWALISVIPIDDALLEGVETAVVRLIPPLILNVPAGQDYRVGWPSNAVVTIADNEGGETNLPPIVSVAIPTNGATFSAPANIWIFASAQDSDGFVDTVEFFEGTNSLGVATNSPYSMSPVNPFRVYWTNVPPGSYSLRAKATDNAGAMALSAPVHITVEQKTDQPIVNITTDGFGAEIDPRLDIPSDPAVFTVWRTGGQDVDVPVYYSIGGTASNGLDYARLSGMVTIPAGSSAAQIVVDVIDDDLGEGTEWVILTIQPPACIALHPPPPDCYVVGPSNRAIAYIRDNDNAPPFVRLNQPQDGEIFSSPATIVLRAYAHDEGDNNQLKVEFFEGTNSLGFGTFVPSLCPAPYCPYYQLIWSNVPPGDYVLTAVAIDGGGLSSRSDPAHIRVVGTNEPATVNILASDPDAAEPDDDPNLERPTILNPGVFTVTRSGPTNIDLPVYYHVGGSASNGVDYARLSGQVTIPAGSRSARIEVDPIDDVLREGTETAIATVDPPVCIAIYPPPPECYRVGPSNRATVFIRDNDSNTLSNHPPVVRITAPIDGATLKAGSEVTIDAVTTDPDGYAPRVEFFANNAKIGEQEIHFIQAPPPGEPIYFSFGWSNVMAGNYTLTARATDNQGAMGLSAPVHISVVGTNAPPTNGPPIVTIRAPDPYAWEGVHGTNTPSSSPGTNTALFAIHRSGATNADLTVFYAISGTASNGVDYLTISDRVTIPAGHRVARILITPVDDALAERDETVILTLRLPSSGPSNSAPPYVIGWPYHAAAVIADDDRPRLACRRLSDGVFHLCLPGTNGHCFAVHAASDLANWIVLCTNVVIDGAVHYVDPDAPERPHRFYRVVPEALAPAEE